MVMHSLRSRAGNMLVAVRLKIEPALMTARATASMDNCYDAIVIGAGPTGLTLSLFLKSKGLSVCIIEKHTTSLPYS